MKLLEEVLFMRKWVIPLLLIVCLLLPLSVRAQDPVSINSLEIDIWPEYDKPSVLVIYHLALSSSTSFPANLSIRIPITAGDPYAVAERQVNGSLYTINPTRQVIGNWAIISFTTTESEVQLEYYDPGLVKDGNARHFQYTWPGDYAVSQLTIQVQEPSGATDMRISPSLGAGEVGTDGLTYYSQDLGAVSALQTIQITVDYKKSSDALSVENLPIEPSASIPPTNAVDLNISTLLPWILGILGAGLIIGGSIWFWQSGRQRPATKPLRRRSRKTGFQSETISTTDEGDIYCSQCGKRAQPGDQFCRSCGAPIRSH
jgi:hypothetical protein